jgi:hemophore-related protein
MKPSAQALRIGIGLAGGGLFLAGVLAPAASAAPDCSPEGVQATSDSVTAAAQGFLAGHPDANRVLMTAALQPHDQAEATVRAYTSTHPNETAQFRQILNPLYQTQQVCNVSVVPPAIAGAFNEFMGAG